MLDMNSSEIQVFSYGLFSENSNGSSQMGYIILISDRDDSRILI